ncbi:MAG: PilC/PilY family type IV pilus protein [Acidobacteriota bacterium]|nr:PilC/PilY family type IV pilus protein [Acidobacteriota bacterium]
MTRHSNSSLGFALACLLTLGLVATAGADDRRLITGFEEIPTVFFLFDTSGSMHWSAQCLQEDFDAGECDYLCPSGDCWVPANADHPSSKFYQAKEAIYNVISQTEDINVGFATFNQDSLRLRRKHWLYAAAEGGPTIPGWGPYPAVGDLHSFGQGWRCTTGSGADANIGCSGYTPADLIDPWENQRVAALPKESDAFPSDGDNDGVAGRTTYFVRAGGSRYRIRIEDRGAADLGSPTITVRVYQALCTNDSCSSTTGETHEDVDFDLVTDYGYWEFTTDRGPLQAGFFTQGTASDSPATNTCVNWDANTDTPADIYSGYNARWPTVPDGSFSPLLDVGDVLPMDWRDSNQQKLLERLAPNLALGDTVPDFRIATYFEDIVNPSDELHLKDERARPIMAFGATPIGTSVGSFFDFVAGPGSWLEAAAENDPSFYCRRTYLVIITDGNQSDCDGDDPCADEGTAELFDDLGIKTFVVAFGVAPHTPFLPRCTGDPEEQPNVDCCAGDGEPLCIPSDDPSIPADGWPAPNPARVNRSLRCMASTGGTGDEDYDLDGEIDSEDGPGVIYPQNQDELVDALVSILDQIKPAPSSFSTAAVPSVQAEAADKVFLSDFTPVPERSTWWGRVNAFLKPLPVDDENKPDISIVCPPDDLEDPNDDPSACLLWEAGEVILAEQIDPSDPVGDLASQRRIYYGENGIGVPRVRHFLEETEDGTTPPAQEFDLWRGFDLDFDPLEPSTFDAARDDANDIIDYTLSVKTTPVNEDFPVAIDYVLGDIFHSDPLLLGSPNNLFYFFADLDGYRDFAFDHSFRRRVLLFATNSGIVHGIDAGVCRDLIREDPRPCLFDNGSGRELFGFVPRTAMPTMSQLALDTVPRHRYATDGRTQAADVFIDPVHAGALVPPPLGPDPDAREWRTVLVGGLREGGNLVPEGIGDITSPADANPNDSVLPTNQAASGYYALDLTLPDPLEIVPPGETRPPIPQAVGVEPPSCLRTADGVTPIDPDCGPIAFAAPLWEFRDTVEGVRLDEDDNGHVDLAFAWSNPSLGRIQVCTESCSSAAPTLEDRYVAVVGGGYDPKSPFLRGNYLYMIDIETGEAIYKFNVLGAVAGEPAAVDKDFDGYIDTIYVGTSLGLLYRATLAAYDDDGDGGAVTPPKYPQIETVSITETAYDGTVVARDLERIVDPDFAPRVLLDANDAPTDPPTIPPVVRPIFFRPSVAYLPKFNQYAIAVGTGDRENIFGRTEPSGRFFVFVDDVEHSEILSPSFVPFSESSSGLTALTPTSPRLEQVDLLQPGEGWWLELAVNERVVTEPFALSGILFFSTFIPDPDGPEVIPEDSLCREKGLSNIYGVFTSNADGLLTDDPDIGDPSDLVRFVSVSGLVSSPFTEQSQTKNPPPDVDQDVIDDLSAHLEYIRDRLKEQFPENCTFPPGYRIDVKTRNSGTNIDFIAPVPICVVEKSFREF